MYNMYSPRKKVVNVGRDKRRNKNLREKYIEKIEVYAKGVKARTKRGSLGYQHYCGGGKGSFSEERWGKIWFSD
jgi:hypothetical protein